MKSVIIEAFGGTEVLKIVENVEVPSIHKNQVLVENYSAGINPHDLYLRAGYLASILGKTFPITPGLDFAGKIVAVGDHVSKFKVGDHVYGMMDANAIFSPTGFAKTGAYAEFIATREDTLSAMPKNITFKEASSIPLVSLTAYQAIVKKAHAKKGQKILINGASGGVGSMAIQIANHIGLEVTAVCHSKTHEFVSSLSPHAIINYDKTDFTTLKNQFDIIFDVVGNKDFKLCEQNLFENGIYISNVPTENTFKAYQNPDEEEKYGFNKRNKYNWVHPLGKDLEEITKLILNLDIKTLVNKAFNINEVSEAHNYIENHLPIGKTILSIKKEGF